MTRAAFLTVFVRTRPILAVCFAQRRAHARKLRA
eukprot:CAMPEP_0198533298 /NCGR_PEP_ID=MMETSP1462-20131121/32995_1 /TAXON_ID=1333877 /ORGANISM="Brandtodinium nutriculum, Strain RCC3387" /LENGTH=33 /DNA_ID= /DNA_START= /DNA_END= /DNA_ORIENTATION=